MNINSKLTIKYIVIPAFLAIVILLVAQILFERVMKKTLLLVEAKAESLLEAEERFDKKKKEGCKCDK